ncbi:MAG: hypothetical protein QMB16_09225 [Paracoccaceae bacterium]
MLQREELLDMAVHALAPLMSARKEANAYDLFDESLEIARKLIVRVDDTAARTDETDRDELLDMGVHALSALLKGRQSSSVDDLLDECMDVAQKLIAKVDDTIGDSGDGSGREELLDLAVHAQTAFLAGRPPMDAAELCNHCVEVAQGLISKVDGIAD